LQLLGHRLQQPSGFDGSLLQLIKPGLDVLMAFVASLRLGRKE
jgi:hypothetical protein